MWIDEPWHPLLIAAVFFGVVMGAAGVVSATVALLSPRQQRIVGGAIIVMLIAGSVVGWSYALFLPPIDLGDPDCVGPPYARC